MEENGEMKFSTALSL